MARIVRFETAATLAEEGAPDRILSGRPVTVTRNHHTSADGRFFSGEWRSSPGVWRVLYDEDEFVTVLEGRCVLTDDGGHAEAFGPGQSFVIPKGFSGTWETLEPLRKLYAIYVPPSS